MQNTKSKVTCTVNYLSGKTYLLGFVDIRKNTILYNTRKVKSLASSPPWMLAHHKNLTAFCIKYFAFLFQQ